MDTTTTDTTDRIAPAWAELEALCAALFEGGRRPCPAEIAILADADEALERLEARIDRVVADAAEDLRRAAQRRAA